MNALRLAVLCLFTVAYSPAITWTSIFHLDAGAPVDVSDAQGAHNGINHGATSAAGYLNASAVVAGTNTSSSQYVEVANNFLTGTTFTVDAWIYVTAFPAGAGEVGNITSSGYDGTSTPWQFWVDDQRKLRCSSFNGTAVVGIMAGAASIPANTWTYVACTYNAGTWITYINGVQDATASATKGASSGSKTLIGANWFGDISQPYHGFNGRIDEVRYSTGVATPSEIANAYTTTIPVTDANWFFAPYASYSDGSAALGANNVRTDATKVIWTNLGAYFKVAFNSTSVSLAVAETGVMQGKVRWSIDNGAWQTGTLAGDDTRLPLATGLSAGTHTLWFGLYAMYTAVDRWTGNPPQQSLQITGLVLNGGGATTSAPSGAIAVESKNVLFYGDSITEGYGTLAANTHDATRSWTYPVARALGAEYGLVGFSGTGWLQTVPLANLPAFANTWNLYFSGASRLFSGKLSPIPDYVVVNHGYNDSTNNTVATVRSWLTAIRAAVNTSTPVFVVVPFPQVQKANLTAAVAAQGDPHVHLIDLGEVYSTAGLWTYDFLHPTAEANAWIGAKVIKAITTVLVAPGAGPRHTIRQ